MASPTNDATPAIVHVRSLQILPEGGHEVPAILVFTIQARIYALGNIKEDLKKSTNVMIRLGSKVSEGHPSCVGFRILMRTDTPKSEISGSIDDHYHVVSCRFDPSGGNATYAKATAQNKQDLAKIRPAQISARDELKAGSDQDVYLMNFDTYDTNGCIVSHHGPDLQTTDINVKEVEKLASLIPWANRLSLYFIADKLLVTHLAKAFQHNYVGAIAPCWKTALSENANTQWPLNRQTQMVAGMTEILNVLLRCLREQPLLDGQGTSLADRSEAVQFNDFVHKAYPDIQRGQKGQALPILLNVSDGALCIELPFGASMFNRINTYAAINALHGLLATGVPASRIGLVTLYPAQVEAYRAALDRCHNCFPGSGYNLVQLDILENWAQRTVGIAIVDLVRTSNASGNLGYLSQANRLRALLALHENGLIVVGNRECTTTSHGTVTSTKLDKVLQWFNDHGRIIQISERGVVLPLVQESDCSTSEEKHDGPRASQVQTVSAPGSRSAQPDQQLKYVGIPGLEHLRIDKPIIEKIRKSKNEHKQKDQIAESFARQLLSIKQPSRPGSKTPTDHDASKILVSNDNVRLSNTNADAYITFAQPGLRPISQQVRPEFIAKARSQNTLGDTRFRSAISNAKDDHAESSTPKEEDPDAESRFDSSFKIATPEKPLTVPEANISPTGDASSDMKELGTMANEMSVQRSDSLVKADKGPAKGTNLSTKSSSDLLSPPVASITRPVRPGVPSLEAAETPSLHTNAFPQIDKAESFATFIDKVSDLSSLFAGARKENIQPRLANEVSSLRHSKLKVEKESPSSPFSLKLLPHQASLKPSTEYPSKTAARDQSPSPKPGALPFQARQTLSSIEPIDLVSPQPAKSSRIETAPKSKANIAHEAWPVFAPELLPKKAPNFKDRYQSKYRAIRSQFAGMNPKAPRTPEVENRLFRQLAEAFMDGNEQAFDGAYTSLLGMAARIQTSVLKR